MASRSKKHKKYAITANSAQGTGTAEVSMAANSKGTKANGACKACQKAKCRCEFEAGASACTKCIKAGKSDSCVPQDSRTRSARGRSAPPTDSFVIRETEPTQAVPTAKTQKPAARKCSSSTTSVAAVPAQVKQ
ncbi:hypothetical protein PAXRUDRAFT_21765 [Paxillus rubicundulus Ve08.2h10]|uniref:Zn(2)-C6 fungal-type domain-containing protein n=1 Tax=Paxillus rubicundulus Ve08.2h10 TaxID=930991 RepID=A0A0D0D6T1_9AGAM|nr:hypothetical protein PAXRUDRAFT_21765 [Paxillus rubicundulus Ve08.2h10]